MSIACGPIMDRSFGGGHTVNKEVNAMLSLRISAIWSVLFLALLGSGGFDRSNPNDSIIKLRYQIGFIKVADVQFFQWYGKHPENIKELIDKGFMFFTPYNHVKGRGIDPALKDERELEAGDFAILERKVETYTGLPGEPPKEFSELKVSVPPSPGYQFSSASVAISSPDRTGIIYEILPDYPIHSTKETLEFHKAVGNDPILLRYVQLREQFVFAGRIYNVLFGETAKDENDLRKKGLLPIDDSVPNFLTGEEWVFGNVSGGIEFTGGPVREGLKTKSGILILGSRFVMYDLDGKPLDLRFPKPPIEKMRRVGSGKQE